jgi:hypothetical protein
MSGFKERVIPQNFLFDREAGERKFMRDPIWFLLTQQEMGSRTDSHFCKQKSEFCGMTLSLN